MFDGQDELLPLPGSPDAANPVLYKQISGQPVTFDAVTGERSGDDGGGTAVFALTEGVYWCLLAESNGEAALFDAPEGEIDVCAAVIDCDICGTPYEKDTTNEREFSGIIDNR